MMGLFGSRGPVGQKVSSELEANPILENLIPVFPRNTIPHSLPKIAVWDDGGSGKAGGAALSWENPKDLKGAERCGRFFQAGMSIFQEGGERRSPSSIESRWNPLFPRYLGYPTVAVWSSSKTFSEFLEFLKHSLFPEGSQLFPRVTHPDFPCRGSQESRARRDLL